MCARFVVTAVMDMTIMSVQACACSHEWLIITSNIIFPHVVLVKPEIRSYLRHTIYRKTQGDWDFLFWSVVLKSSEGIDKGKSSAWKYHALKSRARDVRGTGLTMRTPCEKNSVEIRICSCLTHVRRACFDLRRVTLDATSDNNSESPDLRGYDHASLSHASHRVCREARYIVRCPWCRAAKEERSSQTRLHGSVEESTLVRIPTFCQKQSQEYFRLTVNLENLPYGSIAFGVYETGAAGLPAKPLPPLPFVCNNSEIYIFQKAD